MGNDNVDSTMIRRIVSGMLEFHASPRFGLNKELLVVVPPDWDISELVREPSTRWAGITLYRNSKDNNRIIGVMSMVWDGPDVTAGVFVTPPFRGRGLARELCWCGLQRLAESTKSRISQPRVRYEDYIAHWFEPLLEAATLKGYRHQSIVGIDLIEKGLLPAAQQETFLSLEQRVRLSAYRKRQTCKRQPADEVIAQLRDLTDIGPSL